MNRHKQKMVAPIIITALVLVYLAAYGIGIAFFDFPLWIKGIGFLILVVLGGADIFILKERINEIRSGDEDDLGKY